MVSSVQCQRLFIHTVRTVFTDIHTTLIRFFYASDDIEQRGFSEPDGPSNTQISPSAISQSIPLNTSTRLSPSP